MYITTGVNILTSIKAQCVPQLTLYNHHMNHIHSYSTDDAS